MAGNIEKDERFQTIITVHGDTNEDDMKKYVSKRIIEWIEDRPDVRVIIIGGAHGNSQRKIDCLEPNKKKLETMVSPDVFDRESETEGPTNAKVFLGTFPILRYIKHCKIRNAHKRVHSCLK